jgi:hypothetical protein
VANTLTGLVPTLYESLDLVSREFVGFIPAVQRDNGNFARAAVGQVVSVPIVPAVTAANIVPGVTAPNDGDQVLTTVNMQLNNAKYVPIRWNGEEQLGLNNGGPGVSPILRNQFAQAFRTLTNAVESTVSSAAVIAASRAVGTAGTTPFATAANLNDTAGVARILDENGAPMTDRHLVLSSPAMSNIRGTQANLFKVNEAGTDDLLRRGSIGELEGFALHYSPTANKLVTGGTGTGFVTGAAYPIGTTVIAVGTGTGTINAGDIVRFAGDTNQYVVVTGTTGPGSITIGVPGLKVAAASGAAITIVGSYTPNVAFTRDAIVLATRAPAEPQFNGITGDMADDATLITDEFSGLTFEVRVYRQYRQIKFEVGLVWGAAVIKQDHVAILEG